MFGKYSSVDSCFFSLSQTLFYISNILSNEHFVFNLANCKEPYTDGTYTRIYKQKIKKTSVINEHFSKCCAPSFSLPLSLSHLFSPPNPQFSIKNPCATIRYDRCHVKLTSATLNQPPIHTVLKRNSHTAFRNINQALLLA